MQESYDSRIRAGAKRSEQLKLDPLIPVLSQIPARRIAHVREQRVHAGFVTRIFRQKLYFVIFPRNGIVRVHGDGRKWRAVCRNPVAEHSVVSGIGDGSKQKDRQHGAPEETL
jgi:hypothetical protein